jgi:RNA-directed DNA polymerase
MSQHGKLYVHAFPACGQLASTEGHQPDDPGALHHRSDKSLQDLAAFYNPYIRGWINYYGQFYRKQLRPTLLRIDTYLVRWARWKFKRLRRRHWGAREWVARVRYANPTRFSYWRFLYVGSRASEAV